MIYERFIWPKLKKHLKTKQVTVLTGMRRTGKTTLLNQLIAASEIKQKLTFDLERIDYRALFSSENYEDVIYVLQQRGIDFSSKVIIGIDEIQLVPNLPSIVKYLYDHYDIKFILTGSSSYYLKNKFSESLAGRKKIFEIFPLTFREFLLFKGVPFLPPSDFTKIKFHQAEYNRLKLLYEDYINYGGFPEVVLTTDTSLKIDLINDIISSYINFDLTAISDIQKSTEIFKLIKLLASRIGSKVDISKLSRISDISRRSVENYLELFEQSYLICLMPVYSSNPEREIVKARKLYFMDNGIASLFDKTGSGSLFENAIFNQLQQLGELRYYALKSGKEIDFILDQQRAFEVKETALETHLNTVKLLANNLGIKDTYVISRNVSHSFPGMIWGGFVG